ncbi:MAG: hypothetical protein HYS12_28710 [Planctomycetes bacterium]|nr:hypothetical protein [Planctomycetota bacterium]
MEATTSHTDTIARQQQEQRQRVATPLATGLAAVAGLLRLVPHPFNMTPIGALGLFGGARLRTWLAFVLPLAVMGLSDLVLWAVLGYPPFNPFVYASFAVYVLLGRLLTRTESTLRIGTVCILGTIQFFLLTNLGMWWASSAELPEGTAVVWTKGQGMYPSPTYARNAAGLMGCYAAALPFTNTNAPPLGFFGNVLLGDLLFCGLLFGAHAWLSRRYFRPVSASALVRTG